MASVMGICASLVEPKSENVEKVLFFKAFAEVSRGARGCQPNEQLSGPEHFLVTLGDCFLVYEGDFGSLWDHFGAIVR